jgi:hypothetical protein
VTSGLRGARGGRFLGAPCPARALPRPLVRARIVEIATTTLTSQLSITATTARGPTHLLCRLCRRGHREHLPALGTSTTHRPRASDPAVAPISRSWIQVVWPRWIRSRRRGGSRSRAPGSRSCAAVAPGLAPALEPPAWGGSGPARASRHRLRDQVARDPAARWIRLRAPLKKLGAAHSFARQALQKYAISSSQRRGCSFGASAPQHRH